MSGLEVNYLVHLQSFARKIFSTSELVSKFFPNVWEIYMILTYKHLLVDIHSYQNHSHFVSF